MLESRHGAKKDLLHHPRSGLRKARLQDVTVVAELRRVQTMRIHARRALEFHCTTVAARVVSVDGQFDDERSFGAAGGAWLEALAV